MKYFILFAVYICNSLTLFSQSEKINWLIFIDDKIPESNMLNGEFIRFEGTPEEKIINFEYTIGDINVNKEDLKILKSADNLTVRLYYKKQVKKTQYLYIYSFQIPSRLLFKYDYVVLNIRNVNKKKGYFYFDYSSDYEKTIRIEKNTCLFNKTNNKSSIKYKYSKEIIMREIGKEKRKIIIVDS